MGKRDQKVRSVDNRESNRNELNRLELADLLARFTGDEAAVTPMENLSIYRSTAPTEPAHITYEPCFCVIAQGRKQVTLGDETYLYDPAHYLLASVDLPVFSKILTASPQEPYLGLTIKLDPVLVGSVIMEAAQTPSRLGGDVSGMAVSRLEPDLLDATVRLLRLLDSPRDVPMLAPTLIREIVYRLLVGDQGGRLQLIARLNGQSHRIARAVERLKSEFDKPLRVERLAQELGMSVSGFHRHFKVVTAMSPLQFQKQLRMQEARRLMLVENLDAAGAGFKVGYEDASHFSRDYKRLFGEPPMRDVERLRGAIDV